MAALRIEDALIAHALQSGRAAISGLDLMKHPEARKRVVLKAFGDEDPRTVIKELKKFSKSLDAIQPRGGEKMSLRLQPKEEAGKESE